MGSVGVASAAREVKMLVYLVSTTLILVLLYTWRRSRWPGPKRIPLLGSTPWLTRRRGATDWVLDPSVVANKISLVQVGPGREVLVINDFQLVKDLFSRDEF